jgi:hypothetical protein
VSLPCRGRQLIASFNIVSEMRDPRKYTRALSFSLSMITVLYLIIGSVVYYFCGQYVSTPALGSAGVLLKKVSPAWVTVTRTDSPGLLRYCHACAARHWCHLRTCECFERQRPDIPNQTDRIARIKDHLCPPAARLASPQQQQPHALAHVVRLHTVHLCNRIHYRVGGPQLWQYYQPGECASALPAPRVKSARLGPKSPLAPTDKRVDRCPHRPVSLYLSLYIHVVAHALPLRVGRGTQGTPEATYSGHQRCPVFRRYLHHWSRNVRSRQGCH